MRFRFFAPLALTLSLHAAFLATPLPAFAQQPKTTQDYISLAQQQYDDLKYDESTSTLIQALSRPDATKDQKIDIYKLLFYDQATLGHKEDAAGWAVHLLQLNPSYDLPTSESPRFRTIFTDAKKKWEADGKPGLVTAGEAPPAPVVLQHNSPSQVDPGTQIALLVRPTDPQHRVASVNLYYRSGGADAFDEQSAHIDGTGAARASIPPSVVKAPYVEYYFIAYDKAGAQIAFRGDPQAPLRIAVPEPTKGWILPVAIGGGILGAAAIVGGLALAGVFKSSSKPTPTSAVTISIGE
jgi:hypothetical protein